MNSRTPPKSASPSCIADGPYEGFDIRSICVEVVIVTPAMARTLRDTCHFERQRDIKPANIERLLSEGRRGTFVPGTPVFVCVLPDKSMHIVNGNHTLEMVAALGHPVPLTFIYVQAEDLNAAGTIYATFDIHKMRTWLDGMRAVGLTDDSGVGRSALPALGLIIAGFAYDPQAIATLSRDLRFKLFEEYRDAMTVLAAALKGSPKEAQQKIRAAPVFCVALATARYQPTAAAEFWGGMAHDDGLGKDDPRKALMRFVTNSRSKKQASRTETVRAAILAWNAHFRGDTLETCKPNAAKHVKILGTPFGSAELVQPRTKRAAGKSPEGEPSPAPRPLFSTGQRVDANATRQVTIFEG